MAHEYAKLFGQGFFLVSQSQRFREYKNVRCHPILWSGLSRAANKYAGGARDLNPNTSVTR